MQQTQLRYLQRTTCDKDYELIITTLSLLTRDRHNIFNTRESLGIEFHGSRTFVCKGYCRGMGSDRCGGIDDDVREKCGKEQSAKTLITVHTTFSSVRLDLY
jgi:hypothetical protein